MFTFAQRSKAASQKASAIPSRSAGAKHTVQRAPQHSPYSPQTTFGGPASPSFALDFGKISLHPPADSTEPNSALRQATEGESSAVPRALRDRMERSTGASLERVRLHTGSGAHRAARMLNARAFTVGHDISFGEGQFRPGDREGDRLIAHELVHTIQQGPGARADRGAPLDVSEPGDAAEAEADRIADAAFDGNAAAGRPAPMRVTAARRAISRVEFKNGKATFKLDPYTENDSDNGHDTARDVGAAIDITYTSAEDCVTDKIGFIQTMKTIQDGSPLLFDNEKNRATKAADGEAGWALDRLKDKKSPIYSQDDSGASGGNTIFGKRSSPTVSTDAWMHDMINLPRAVGQKLQSDAVTYAFDETHGKYLGGVSWGFVTDAKGVTKKIDPALKSKGGPDGVQKASFTKWNEQAALADATKRNAPDQQKVVVP